MRAVIQRVSSASVRVDSEVVGSIDRGLMILIGIHQYDTQIQADWLAEKIVKLRIFEDSAGKMNLDLQAISGSILAISQFTLYGNCQSGRRPSFTESAKADRAEPLYQRVIDQIRLFGINTATGKFGADMKVSLVNDGPVTLILDTPVSQSLESMKYENSPEAIIESIC